MWKPLALALLASGCASLSHHTTTVPFDFVKHQIIVSATVNGTGPYSFLVDTGATPSVIDKKVAAAAGISVDPSRSTPVEGVGSEDVKAHAIVIPRLRVGDVEYRDMEGLVADVGRLSSRLGHPLHGILGDNFFAGKVVTIDYKAKQLRISNSSRDTNDGIELPFVTAPDDIMPIIRDFEINGHKIAVSLDTGSSLGLELYKPGVAEAGLTELAAKGRKDTVTGASGEAEVGRAEIDSVRIGGLPVEHVGLTFSKRDDYGALRMGNVGNALLSHFIVTFDYIRHRVRFVLSS
jgi:predicted aspartyl protease